MSFEISNITLTGLRRKKQLAREQFALRYDLDEVIRVRNIPIHLLGSVSVSAIDRKVKSGQSLSFEEAFVGMCYVIASTNRTFLNRFAEVLGKPYRVDHLTHDRAIAIGAAFLNLMALKEAMGGLTSEEVAGLVTAGIMDTVFSLKLATVIETCGMGGDRGFGADGARTKSVNVSTLSGIVLAAVGCVVAKHGSYANSTVVGSTDSLELLGANTTPTSVEHIMRLLEHKFAYVDAHLCKTLHDLSHLIMMETINHVIGPMTPPFSHDTPLKKIMGVNEKVSPRAVALAYAKLHARGIQKNDGVIVVAGLGEVVSCHPAEITDAWLRKAVILDEISPFSTFVSITIGDVYVGDSIISPVDFGIDILPAKVQVAGDTDAIHAANISALKGTDEYLADYLAMNAALALYLYDHIGKDVIAVGQLAFDRVKLVECFRRCRDVITRGSAYRTLETFVSVSNE